MKREKLMDIMVGIIVAIAGASYKKLIDISSTVDRLDVTSVNSAARQERQTLRLDDHENRIRVCEVRTAEDFEWAKGSRKKHL